MTPWVWPTSIAIVGIVIVGIVIVGILFPTLTGDERLAFRDVSHFYTPLYDYVAARCAAEWLPMWNPLDQTGMPLIGETTTAVLYPIRYVVFGWVGQPTIAMACYVAIHLIIAAIAASFAARCWGSSRVGAVAAAIMYPMSGCVWFLYTNPPFLVGASWLPIALAAATGPQLMPWRRRVILAAGAMAMMILGGDPQAALHVTMVSAAVLIGRGIRCRAVPAGWSLPIVAPALAAALAAPQLAASIDWSRQSSRVVAEVSMFDPPVRGTPRHESFQFSLPPWHAAELITPNAFGSLLPIYRRIGATIPGDGRIWTPTIYLGLIGGLALIDRLRRMKSLGIDAPLAIAIGSLLLATGHFGLVWWMQATIGFPPNVDSAAGGAYWMLYHFVPGYDALRYPAKWLPMFAIASSIVTARWLDRISWTDFRHCLIVVATLLLGGLGINTYHRFITFPAVDPNTLPIDRFWGPLDLVGGATEVQSSLLHSSLMIAAIAVVFVIADRRRWRRRSRTLLLCVIMVIDVGIVARSLTYTVDVDAEARLLGEAELPMVASDVPMRWMRTQSGGGSPEVWKRTHDQNRLLHVEASQRLSWFGRWHLHHRQAVTNNMVSIQSKAMREFWNESTNRASSLSIDDRKHHWQSLRRRFAIDGVVHTTEHSMRVDDAELMHVIRAGHPSSSIDDRDQRTVTLTQPTTLVRPVFQDGNWTAAYRSPGDQFWIDAPVRSHHAIHQSVMLPTGTWQIRFVYRPWWWIPSLATAAIGWIAWAITASAITASVTFNAGSRRRNR